MNPAHLFNRLSGGKAYSLGNTIEVVNEILARPGLFAEFLQLFHSDDAQVIMRAANGLKRLFKEPAFSFAEHKLHIIPLLKDCPQDSARWTLVQLLKTYRNCLDDQEIIEARIIAESLIGQSNEWITLVQSMDLLLKLKTQDNLSGSTLKRIEALSKDPRRAVSRKAAALLDHFAR